MRCQKCQFECDNEDVFCRKCGANLTAEGDFTEVVESAAPVESVTPVQIIEHNPTNFSVIVETKKPNVIAKVARVIGSETGQKIVKGAAVLAIGVVADLITQAAERRKPTKNKPAPTTALSRAINAAQNDQSLMPFHSPAPGEIVQSYYYRYERWVVRRVIKRDE